MIALTAICSGPLVYSVIKLEATKDEELTNEKTIIKEHSKAIAAFTFLFLGFVASFLFWFCVLPSATVQNTFSAQIATITEINLIPSGSLVDIGHPLTSILLNNLKILIFCILFSFFFGAGAIFILTWNASVLATAVGLFVRNSILSDASQNFFSISQYLSVGLMKYIIHGLPEIIAYFIGGLAGGIISIAAIRHDYKTKEFKKIVLDALDILLVSVLILVVAGLIEVFITPALFN
jgi:uncharacterized membrane protein SpoIIM required for sporulation